MNELTLLVLRLGFLLLLWVFIFVIVYSLRSDLFGQRTRRSKTAPTAASTGAPTAVSDPAAPPRLAPSFAGTASTSSAPTTNARPAAGRTNAPPSRLVITAGPREGQEIDLPSEQLTIGRASESGLVIRDDYTSTHHARLMLWNEQWVVQDLDSTNGTFLDGTRVTLPTPIPPGATVTVGKTSFELRR